MARKDIPVSEIDQYSTFYLHHVLKIAHLSTGRRTPHDPRPTPIDCSEC